MVESVAIISSLFIMYLLNWSLLYYTDNFGKSFNNYLANFVPYSVILHLFQILPKTNHQSTETKNRDFPLYHISQGNITPRLQTHLLLQVLQDNLHIRQKTNQ